ncbi:MAG: class IV adenylate cyclase [Candidatus Poribacteria bacterium]|nr:class IV adenylate cyclase [Candidatus Poribacteria bacterium]
MSELPHRNLEFKAEAASLELLRTNLRALEAECSGRLHQIDTYFDVPKGRLKLREVEDYGGTLVYYERPDAAESRYSHYQLCDIANHTTFKQMMSDVLRVKVIVEKNRELWIYGNTRIHLDEVLNLGEFIELETVIRDQSEAEAQTEHNYLKQKLHIAAADLIPVSYSDLLLGRNLETGIVT